VAPGLSTGWPFLDYLPVGERQPYPHRNTATSQSRDLHRTRAGDLDAMDDLGPLGVGGPEELDDERERIRRQVVEGER
jgi:hypothetical protein